MRASGCIYRDLALAERTDLRGWSLCRLRFLEGIVSLVDSLDDHEQDKGNQQELDDILDEAAVGKHSGTGILRSVQTCVVFTVQCDEHAGKVDLSSCNRYDRHDDVVDQRIDDGAECAADDDTDSHIDDVSARYELSEFLHKTHGNLPPSADSERIRIAAPGRKGFLLSHQP